MADGRTGTPLAVWSIATLLWRRRKRLGKYERRLIVMLWWELRGE